MYLFQRLAGYFRWFAVLLCMVLPAGTLWAQSGTQVLTGTIAAVPEPSAYEADFTLTVTLNVPTGSPAPSGTMNFYFTGAPVNATPITVNGNTVSATVSAPQNQVGTYSISATYSGDANYAPVNIPPQNHVIRLLHSSMGLQVTTPTYHYGETLDAVAQVGAFESAPDATVNGGVTSFYVDGNDICDLPVNNGSNSCPDSAGKGFNAGIHVLVATYSGNQYYDNSTSTQQSFTVLTDDTTIGLASSLNPAVFGQVVTFTATMTSPYAVPTGTVVFSDGGVVLGTGTLDANGIATFSSSTLVIGTHPITAAYAATQNFNASNSTTVTQIITLPPPVSNPTVTLLSSSANPSVFGQNVTFTASVATTGAFVQIPTGTVTFKDGSTVLGTAVLDASGNARFSTTALAVGQHPITASYPGAGSLLASTSSVLTQIVTASLTSRGNGFLLTVTPTSVLVGVGNTASVSVNVLPLNGFNQPVQLSCTSLPDEAVCNFDVTTIPAAGGTTRLAITPAAPHDCNATAPYFVAGVGNTGLPVLAAGVIVFFASRRRVLKGIALAAMLCVLPALSGCGNNCTDLGVKPGNYTFTVQGTSQGSSPVTQTQTVQMTVHI